MVGVRVSDDYLRVVLLDTLTPGQRCAQAVHAGVLWGNYARDARVDVRIGDADTLARLVAALRASVPNGFDTVTEPDAASGGPGMTAVIYSEENSVVRAIREALPRA